MNVSEMENLIQQITDQICQQLLSSSYSVALAEAKEAFPEEMFVRFPDVNWVTKEQKLARGLVVKRLTISQVNAIAHLQETDELVKNILAFLFEGKPVLVLTPIPSVSKITIEVSFETNDSGKRGHVPTVWADFYHDSENYAVFQAACQNNFVLWLRPNEPTLLKNN